jgi:hypothetical protein
MKGRGSSSRANANNYANQLNPNNAAYWSSRGVAAPASGAGTPPPTAPTEAPASPNAAEHQAPSTTK